jgi:hypothetical protein
MPLSCRPSLQQKSSHLGGEPSFATSVSNRRLALEADPHTSLQVLRLFNNIVGASKQLSRHIQVQGLRGLQVNY